MLRRLLPAAVVVLAASLGTAGCADDVSPALRVGDITVSESELEAEIEAWAGSPTLLAALQVEQQVGPIVEDGVRGHTMSFVDLVLSYRVNFELHNDEFEARDLRLTTEDLQATRADLLGESTPAVLEELGEDYADGLVADVARLSRLQQELGPAEYEAWITEAFARSDIEVNPRYGAWDPAAQTVVPPSGPRPAPSEDDLSVEL